MARLIDLDKIKPIEFPSTEMDGLDVVRYLETLPTVDAVEVVRCEDCKYRTYDGYHKHHYCSNTRGCRYVILPDHFCSYGERKNDG